MAENVAIVRHIWEAAERGDTDAVFALYAPDIVWESRNLGPIGTGRYHGHEGVRQFFRDWLDAFGTYVARADTFIEAGSNVVVGYRVTGRGKASGVEVEMPRWNVYSFENGLVNRVEVFDAKDAAMEAAADTDDTQTPS